MRYLILSGDVKDDGLCQAIKQDVIRGASDGGAEVQVLSLEGIESCRLCDEGGSSCRNEHRCVNAKDGFEEAHTAVNQSDALCIIAPVLWGEMTEPLKNFMERLRHCEYGVIGALADKPILITAVPEGGNHGFLTCLEHMDRFCRNTGAVVFDCLGVTRWNSDYQRASAYAAAKSMAYGRKAGDQG
ncbi:MAG: NAD(P)H-dependent oxidoreductase [Peptococcaceae bacterium]|jgi:multimeric flavodoxin WrbA|nr:NAD(P)H-dependent oxidoreductase [Peptococcaceae bacterium]